MQMYCPKHGPYKPIPEQLNYMCPICCKSKEEIRMVHCMKHGAYDERLNLCPECPEPERAREIRYQAEALDPQVSAPPHYVFGFGKLQTIDLIVEVLSKQHDPVAAYCLGNTLKYLTRFGRKDGIRDLKKAHQYLGWMIEYIEKGKITHA